MSYKFNESELTSEKSIWDIYKLSRKLKSNKSHIFIVMLATTLLGINAFILESNLDTLISDTRLWANMGFSFSISTLGFLIAGFTIFATLSKPDMMLAMMDHIDKKTGLPTLKCNFFAFMTIFISYIVLSVCYLCVVLFGQENGFLSNLLEVFLYRDHIKSAIIKVSYIFIGSSFIYLLLLLKTFVFNIYAIVMNALRWECIK